jgi:two-component system response regulator HydG
MRPAGMRFALTPDMSHAARILVVDDEPNARSALSELLRDEGYDVLSAANGLDARRRLDDFWPDLVLTDLHMPGLDGRALLDAARARVNAPAVVVMSARDGERLNAPCLRKPIDIDELLHVVAAQLRGRSH